MKTIMFLYVFLCCCFAISPLLGAAKGCAPVRVSRILDCKFVCEEIVPDYYESGDESEDNEPIVVDGLIINSLVTDECAIEWRAIKKRLRTLEDTQDAVMARTQKLYSRVKAIPEHNFLQEARNRTIKAKRDFLKIYELCQLCQKDGHWCFNHTNEYFEVEESKKDYQCRQQIIGSIRISESKRRLVSKL